MPYSNSASIYLHVVSEHLSLNKKRCGAFRSFGSVRAPLRPSVVGRACSTCETPQYQCRHDDHGAPEKHHHDVARAEVHLDVYGRVGCREVVGYPNTSAHAYARCTRGVAECQPCRGQPMACRSFAMRPPSKYFVLRSARLCSVSTFWTSKSFFSYSLLYPKVLDA